MDRMVREYRVDWLKIDYNMDVGGGCDRTDHGHGAGDGHYRHVMGLYEVIDALRARHPHLLVESCSSGGLRIDLGTLQHFPVSFLSDKNTSAHTLQVFWGALDMLAPNAALVWSWSQTRGAFPSFNLMDPDLSPERLDYSVRTGMLGMFGMSQRLPEMPDWVRERYAHHVDVYRKRIAPLVRAADVYRLTGQPLQEGGGDRWCAFQYAMPEGNGAVFAFRLPGGEPARRLRLHGLEPEATYSVEWDLSDRREDVSGKSLMQEGILLEGLPEEGSALIFLQRR
jgi:alpha-galactosidase